MIPLIVIPARYASIRLPGKPLVDLGGVPMVVRTYRNTVAQADGACVLVATEDIRVADVCRVWGVPCEMTSPDCRTGTDRVAEVAERHRAYDIVLNVQGDEPLMAPGCVKAIVQGVLVTDRVCCGRAPLDPRDVDSMAGKVVCNTVGGAMYISRSPIPYGFALPVHVWYTQVCAYGFTRDALRTFASLPTGRLEQLESIELLRWIENCYPLQMIDVPGERLAVDTLEDVERVRRVIRERGI